MICCSWFGDVHRSSGWLASNLLKLFNVSPIWSGGRLFGCWRFCFSDTGDAPAYAENAGLRRGEMPLFGLWRFRGYAERLSLEILFELLELGSDFFIRKIQALDTVRSYRRSSYWLVVVVCSVLCWCSLLRFSGRILSGWWYSVQAQTQAQRFLIKIACSQLNSLVGRWFGCCSTGTCWITHWPFGTLWPETIFLILEDLFELFFVLKNCFPFSTHTVSTCTIFFRNLNLA